MGCLSSTGVVVLSQYGKHSRLPTNSTEQPMQNEDNVNNQTHSKDNDLLLIMSVSERDGQSVEILLKENINKMAKRYSKEARRVQISMN